MRKLVIAFALTIVGALSSMLSTAAVIDATDFYQAPPLVRDSWRVTLSIIALGPVGTLIAVFRWFRYGGSLGNGS